MADELLGASTPRTLVTALSASVARLGANPMLHSLPSPVAGHLKVLEGALMNVMQQMLAIFNMLEKELQEVAIQQVQKENTVLQHVLPQKTRPPPRDSTLPTLMKSMSSRRAMVQQDVSAVKKPMKEASCLQSSWLMEASCLPGPADESLLHKEKALLNEVNLLKENTEAAKFYFLSETQKQASTGSPAPHNRMAASTPLPSDTNGAVAQKTHLVKGPTNNRMLKNAEVSPWGSISRTRSIGSWIQDWKDVCSKADLSNGTARATAAFIALQDDMRSTRPVWPREKKEAWEGEERECPTIEIENHDNSDIRCSLERLLRASGCSPTNATQACQETLAAAGEE
eukprot:TRINITY_DN32837_c0_g2_i1.p1 TRINITY_DN32837_c0_g2~~TRINITY_DN32837_c0_g2_i1.p1  ORF type:complete len:342 (+),score=85.26 TRINITY_DN32837_c0_g2_i1:90-1115(+)